MTRRDDGRARPYDWRWDLGESVESQTWPRRLCPFRGGRWMLCWAVRLISADVRDAIDVITWPALLPYWGLEFVPGLTPRPVSII